MTDRTQTRTRSSTGPTGFIRHVISDRTPNSNQIVGFLTLLISGAILLTLTGLTVTAAVTAVLILLPVALISAPLWVPAAAVAFAVVAGIVTSCGAAVAGVAAATWVYRYIKGRQPVGSERVDYARSRIADRAREVKDYAAERGIYLTGKVKDAAPGA